MSGEPDPKPEPARRPRGGRTLRTQVHDPAASRGKILLERECRISWCGEPAASCHHLVPKGAPHFGDDVPANLIPLCGSGTTGHHGRVEDYDPAVCGEVGRLLTDAETAYVLRKLGDEPGREFLLRRYHLMVPLDFGLPAGPR